MASRRREVLAAIKQAWSEVRGGSYYVKRGAIDWTAHQFTDKPFACSIQVDECSLPQPWPTKLGRPHEDMQITFELATRIQATTDPQVEDEGLELLIEDLRDVLLGLATLKRTNGDTLLDLLVAETRPVEFHDTTYLVQGLIVGPVNVRF